MYERFTDRARKVLQLANQEARRFNHEYVGTEHILLGLIEESSGVAAKVLKNLDIDLRKIRLDVEKIVQSGHNKVTWSKLPQTPRAKKVIEYAIEEARSLNHNYVGTEHLLLGLLREADGVASQVLWNFGAKFLSVQGLRAEVLKYLGQVWPKEELVGAPLNLPPPPPKSLAEVWPKEEYPSTEAVRKQPLSAESEQIRSLEQQLWSVRIVWGVFAGGFIGAQAGDFPGAVWGLILGGFMPLFGRYCSAPLAGCVTGILLGGVPLPGDYGGLVGALLGLLVGILIAASFAPPKRYDTSILAAVVTGIGLDIPNHHPDPLAGPCLSGAILGLMAGMVTEWFIAKALERERTRNSPWRAR
ncbi:MAG TPA: Clp protease N-terminal domain-containing protein [Gemmataceae bacterium]|jgi:hypothetical protein